MAIKQMTLKRLENIAVSYLARYEASTGKLRGILAGRVRKSPNAPDVPDEWIDTVVARMAGLGYVQDARFAESLARRARAAGKSKRWIEGKLRRAGLQPDKFLADEGPDGETSAALRFIHKKRLILSDSESRRKAMEKLGRAGFSYDAAKLAIERLASEEEPSEA